MATLTLNFLDLNSSLQVGDYVYYSNITTQGGYQISDAYNEDYGNVFLGRVKSIDSSAVQNTLHTAILANNSLPFSKSFTGETSQGDRIVLPAGILSSHPEFLTVPEDHVEVNDFAYSNTVGRDAPKTGKVQSIAQDGDTVELVMDVGFTTSSATPVSWFFSSVSFANNGSKKINLTSTSNIEPGDIVTIQKRTDSTNLFSSVVVSVSTNNHIIVSDEIFVLNSVNAHRLRLQKFHKVVVELENRNDVGGSVLPTLPSSSEYFYFVKDKNANSSGVLGYYAQVRLTNNRTDKAELYSVGAEIFESSK